MVRERTIHAPAGALSPVFEHVWALLPGAFVVYLGFNAGGFFAGTTGVATAAAAVLLAARILLSKVAAPGLTRIGILASGAIALYAGWSLLSATWSHSAARALIESDRAVLYLLIVVMCCAAPRAPGPLRTMIRTLVIGLAAVCGAGLLTRTLPHDFPIGAQFLDQRLSYPVSYWNALGMLAALGVALCVHVASDAGERPAIRAASAGLVPALSATLLLTFSRGSIAALVVALLIYVALAPRLALLTTALAVGPLSAIAVVAAYHADRLAARDPTTPAAVIQGRHVAAVIAACMVGAAVLRGSLTVAERRAPRLKLTRSTLAGATATLAVAVVVVAIELGAPSWIGREYHRFVTGTVATTAPTRERLTSAANNGRLEVWRVAVSGFSSSPVQGLGAGTYALTWSRYRRASTPVQDAHSLYLETLDELGLVGLIMLLVFLVALLIGVCRGARAPGQRAVGAIAIAALGAWAAHAGVDWDWEMPAVSVPVLALAAAAGAGRHSTPARARRWPSRLGGAFCALAVGTAPAFMAISQANLDASVGAFDRGDCSGAIKHASAAIRVMSLRPEPFEIIGYCDAYHGASRLAARAMRNAISRDPNDWEFHYALAVAIALGGQDPRPQLLRTQRLDPREPLITETSSAFRHGNRSTWRRIAATVRIDVP